MKISEDRSNNVKGRFEDFFRKYSKPMFLYALSFVSSEEEAEDIVQEIFMNFWKSESYLTIQDEAVKTYLFRSIRNNCLNKLGKKSVLRDTIDVLYEEAVEDEFGLLNDVLITEIREAIESMSPQTKEIITSVFYQGQKYQEVADRMGISINTVKTLLKNGMRYLRERFSGRLDIFLLFIIER